MNQKLLAQIYLINPWLENPERAVLESSEFRLRLQTDNLLLKEWDRQWIILIGPRRSGKTTLGKFLCQKLRESKRFKEVLYLNCDYNLIRQSLDSPVALVAWIKELGLEKPVVFIDEVQRLESPGLLLKAIADLQLPIKMLASGSSQLEIKSKVQEFLTGRQFSTTILPLSVLELENDYNWQQQALFGSYPEVFTSSEKIMQLGQLYDAYIKKDIVDILRVGKPDVLQRLIGLIAHSSGQLVNYHQLAADCQVTIKTIQHYLSLLEQTFILHRLPPFVGNKRTEITSNPIYYFIDNGMRNYALNNFSPISSRSDKGLLIESFVFQELLKYQIQTFDRASLYFWRTKSGAEVDFIYYRNPDNFYPIEVKFQNLSRPSITKGFRSFLQAYQPKIGYLVNRNTDAKMEVEDCLVHFVSFDNFPRMLKEL